MTAPQPRRPHDDTTETVHDTLAGATKDYAVSIDAMRWLPPKLEVIEPEDVAP